MHAYLLHGFAQPAVAWADVVSCLPADLRRDVALCPTPGHDPDFPVPARWDQAVDELATRIPAGAIAVGYSFGARLVLGLLARDAVRAAILVGVNPGLSDADDRATRIADDAEWAARLRELGSTAGFLHEWEAQPLFATQAQVPLDRRRRRRAIRSVLAPEPLAEAIERLGLGAMPDLAPALLARASRAHLIVGADDVRCRPIADELARRSPELVVDIIEGSGHDPTLEAPEALASVLARALVRFAA